MSKVIIGERRSAMNFPQEHGIQLRRPGRLVDGERFYYGEGYNKRVPRRSWKKRRLTKYKGTARG